MLKTHQVINGRPLDDILSGYNGFEERNKHTCVRLRGTNVFNGGVTTSQQMLVLTTQRYDLCGIQTRYVGLVVVRSSNH